MRIVLVLLLSSFWSLLHGQGVSFEYISWFEAQEKSVREDRLIFVDVYTDWCVPCKWMNSNVFARGDVGYLHNENFLNVKIDAEKGDGVLLREEYGIEAYPTFLVFNSKGELLHKFIGKMEVYPYLDEIQDVLKGIHLKSYGEQFNNGKRDRYFLKDYAEMLNKAGEPAYPATNAYWQLISPSMRFQKSNMEFVYTLVDDVNSELFAFMMENRKRFEQLYTKAIIDHKISEVVNRSINYSVQGKGMYSVDQTRKALEKYFPDEHNASLALAMMKHSLKLGEWDNYYSASELYIGSANPEPKEYSGILRNLWVTSTEKPELLKLAGWAKNLTNRAYKEEYFRIYLGILKDLDDSVRLNNEIPPYLSLAASEDIEHENITSIFYSIEALRESTTDELNRYRTHQDTIALAISSNKKKLDQIREEIIAEQKRIEAEKRKAIELEEKRIEEELARQNFLRDSMQKAKEFEEAEEARLKQEALEAKQREEEAAALALAEEKEDQRSNNTRQHSLKTTREVESSSNIRTNTCQGD